MKVVEVPSNSEASAAVALPFTRPQTCVLQALANGYTPTEAADSAGFHRSAVYTLMDQPRAQLALENAQREYYVAIAGRFHRLANNALRALEQIVDDPKCSPHARIKAATIIFQRLERGQAPIPRTEQELIAINQQCHDPHAPHLTIGSVRQIVTQPEPVEAAQPEPPRQIQTQIPEAPTTPVTDPDASEAPVRQILTPLAEPEHAVAAEQGVKSRIAYWAVSQMIFLTALAVSRMTR